MEQLSIFKNGNQDVILLVLEDSSDFTTETNEAFLIPNEWAKEKKLSKFSGSNIPLELKQELAPYKINFIKSFY